MDHLGLDLFTLASKMLTFSYLKYINSVQLSGLLNANTKYVAV